MISILRMNRKRLSTHNAVNYKKARYNQEDHSENIQNGGSDEEAARLQESQDMLDEDTEVEIVETRNQPEIVEHRKEVRTASHLIFQMESIWTEGSLEQMLAILSTAQKLSLEKDMTMRHIFLQARTLWKKIYQTLCQLEKDKELRDCLWRDFADAIQDDESFTMLSLLKLNRSGLEIWHQSVKEVLIEEQSSSLQNTATTTMSSTIVPIPDQIAVVPCSQNSALEMDVLDEVWGSGTSTQTIGQIQPSISTIRQGKQCILKSPLTSGLIIVKLETFPFQEAMKLPKNKWWTIAHQRTTLVISSIADPNYMLVKKMQNKFAQSILSTPGVEKQEKPITSSNEYSKYQHHH